MAAQKCAEIAVPNQPSAGSRSARGVTGAATAHRHRRILRTRREEGAEQRRAEQSSRGRTATGWGWGRTVVVGGAVDLKQVTERRDLHGFPDAIPQAVHNRDVHRARLEERKVRTPCHPDRSLANAETFSRSAIVVWCVWVWLCSDSVSRSAIVVWSGVWLCSRPIRDSREAMGMGAASRIWRSASGL